MSVINFLLVTQRSFCSSPAAFQAGWGVCSWMTVYTLGSNMDWGLNAVQWPAKLSKQRALWVALWVSPWWDKACLTPLLWTNQKPRSKNKYRSTKLAPWYYSLQFMRPWLDIITKDSSWCGKCFLFSTQSVLKSTGSHWYRLTQDAAILVYTSTNSSQ